MHIIRYLWVFPILVFVLTGIGKLIGAPPLVRNFEALGIADLMVPIGIVQLLSVAIFLVPRTRRVGFFLLCGYIGGIVATRWIHDAQLGPGLVLGALLWAGMWAEQPDLFVQHRSSPAPAPSRT